MGNECRRAFTFKRPLRGGVNGNALNDDVIKGPVAGGVVIHGTGRVHAVRSRGGVHHADGEIGVVVHAGNATQINRDLIIPAAGERDKGADDRAVAGAGIVSNDTRSRRGEVGGVFPNTAFSCVLNLEIGFRGRGRINVERNFDPVIPRRAAGKSGALRADGGIC